MASDYLVMRPKWWIHKIAIPTITMIARIIPFISHESRLKIVYSVINAILPFSLIITDTNGKRIRPSWKSSRLTSSEPL